MWRLERRQDDIGLAAIYVWYEHNAELSARVLGDAP
jgi:hypothetical protein